MKTTLLLSALLLTAAPAVAWAGTQDQARVALHYGATCDKCVRDICDTGRDGPNGQGIPCRDYNTEYFDPGGSRALAFLVVVRADSTAGVAGLRVGVSATPDMGIFGWMTCVDQELPRNDWPYSGSSNQLLWNPDTHCQRTVVGDDGVHAIACAFYIYAYGAGEFCAVPDPTLPDPAFVVLDCSGGESTVTAPGGCVASGSAGYNPCRDEVPLRRLSWGGIKSLY